MHRRLAITACLALAALAVPSVAEANSAPECANPPLSTPRDTDLAMQADCTDPDGDTISYNVTVPPSHGGLIGGSTAGSATYRPSLHYVGPDGFTFTASDGVNPPTVVPVSIQVLDPDGVNSPPECPSPHFFVPVNSTTGFVGNCSDPDAGDPIRYFLVPNSGPDPAVGSLTITSGNSVAFVAGANPGTTSFQYYANDYQVNSAPATVDITVTSDQPGVYSTGSEPTSGAPAVTSVQTTQAGAVIITEVAADGVAPTGLVLLPFQFNIEAPQGDDPMTFTFRLDASAIPPGHDENTVVVLRDGVPILGCTGSGLGPDPCVASRALLPDGDVQLVVLSSHASEWNFAVPVTAPKSGKGCGDRNHAHAREGTCKKPAK